MHRRLVFAGLASEWTRIEQISHAQVKQATDSYRGITSQCFVADKAGIAGRPKQGNQRAQYCANLAMKINAKLGGRNWSLLRQSEIPSIASGPFMVIGMHLLVLSTGLLVVGVVWASPSAL